VKLELARNDVDFGSECSVCGHDIRSKMLWKATIEPTYFDVGIVAVKVCENCAAASKEDVIDRLTARAEPAYREYGTLESVASVIELLLPSPDELREANVIRNFPFSGTVADSHEFAEWLGTRKAAAEAIDDIAKCDIRRTPTRFYVRDENTRGWVAEEDLPPEKAARVRAILNPPAPTPYAERDVDDLPF
jgi:hypothetical protein